MTRLQFRELILDMAKVDGQQHILVSETSALDTLIQDSLEEFTVRSLCLFDDNVPLTLVADTGTYNLRSLTPRIIVPIQVRIEGYPLANPRGRQGRSSLTQFDYNVPSYLTNDSGRPRFWAQVPPHSIRLVPAPSEVFEDVSISGFILHPVLAADATELSIPKEYQWAAAQFTASRLIEPYSSGDSKAKRDWLLAESFAMMERLKAESSNQFGGDFVRASHVGSGYHLG